MLRIPGYYWVKFKDGNNADDIMIGYYCEDSKYPWEIIGSDEIFKDEEFIVISPNPIIFNKDNNTCAE